MMEGRWMWLEKEIGGGGDGGKVDVIGRGRRRRWR